MAEKWALSEEDATEFAKALWKRFAEGGDALHEVVRIRRDHFHNASEVNPSLPDWLQSGDTYQGDELRRTYVRLMTRLTENPWQVSVEPGGDATAAQSDAANRAEIVLGNGLRLLESRLGINIQRGLADAQIKDCFGVLHCRPVVSMYPELPEELVQDVAPPEQERGDWRRERVEGDEGKGKYRWREKLSGREKRRGKSGAKAGFPWVVEVVDPREIAFIEDIFGLAAVVRIRRVGLLDYRSDLENRGAEVKVSLAEDNQRVIVMTEKSAPVDGEAAMRWGRTVGLCEVWLRGECYELVSTTAVSALVSDAVWTDWQFVRRWKTGGTEIPFWFAKAIEVGDNNPSRRWLPALTGMYRLKPFVDLATAFMLQILLNASVRQFYLKRQKDGVPKLDEKGHPLIYREDSMAALEIPEGYELEPIDPVQPQTAVTAVQLLDEKMKEAAPDTGRADAATGTSQPWSMRIMQADASIEPGALIDEIARCIQSMVRHILEAHSKPVEEGGIGGPMWSYGRFEDGALDPSSVIQLEPGEIESLNVNIKISPESAAERITLAQHGVELYQMGVPGMTRDRLIEDYLGWENSGQALVQWDAERAYLAIIQPGMLKRIVATEFGQQIFVAPEGFVNADGQPLDPMQILASRGVKPQQAPAPPGFAGAGAGQGPGMPAMPGLQAPGAMPLQGMGGGMMR